MSAAFNAGRLAVARRRRQFTKKALAAHARISPVTLTRIETGVTEEPDAATVAALAQALQYPQAFFYGEDLSEPTREAVSFRSLSGITARQTEAALAAGSIAFLLARWVIERFNLPRADLLDLRGDAPAMAAAALRTYWGLGFRPIRHLNKVLEAKGVLIFSLCEQNKNVDAYSCWHDGVPCIFLNTFKSAERSRFDAAHELGHLVLHGHGVGGREVEREADAFAAAFLMPREDLLANVQQVSSLHYLIQAKRRWGVSVAALARNCFDAGLLSDWHYRELCRAMSMAGYRTSEPEPMAREESVLWRQVLETLWRERMAPEHLAKELRLPVDELVAMLGGAWVVAPDVPSGKPGLRMCK